MSSTLNQASKIDSAQRRVFDKTMKSIGRTSTSTESDKNLNAQKQKIERCRKVFLRRHASLTRIVEKDLQELRNAQKKSEEEQKRRVSCFTLTNDVLAETVAKTNNENNSKFISLTREDMLLFGLRAGTRCNRKIHSLGSTKKEDLSSSQRNREPVNIGKYSSNLKPSYRKIRFYPNIRA